MSPKELLKIDKLKKYFPVKSGILSRVTNYVKAVDSVDLSINKGETVGLVGESGCGKTTLGKTILKLLEPTEGEIYFENVNITHLPPSTMRPFRREMQIVFQNPYGSLNPRMKVENIVSEGLIIHNIAKKSERKVIISHDLRVVRHISDKVAVMYLGKIVENAPSKDLYKNPLHPYTKILISSVPIADPSKTRKMIVLKGDVPSPINPPSGCSFHPRCPIAVDKCKTHEPQLKDIGNGHFISCHLV